MNRRFATARAAADDVYRWYAARTYSLALRMLGCTAAAEHVTHEVLRRVVCSHDTALGESVWLVRLSVAAVLRHRRSHPTATPPVDGEGESFEVAIGRLPEAYRDVFVLADVERLPHPEVGELLDLSPPTVKSRLHRARLMLLEALQPHFQERSA